MEIMKKYSKAHGEWSPHGEWRLDGTQNLSTTGWSISQRNIFFVSRANLCVSEGFWAAESESGLRFALTRHNFELYLNL